MNRYMSDLKRIHSSENLNYIKTSLPSQSKASGTLVAQEN